MSNYSYVYTVYGFISTPEKLNKTTKERGCKHEISTSAKFCSECGSPAWEYKNKSILEELKNKKKENKVVTPYKNPSMSYFGVTCEERINDPICIGFSLIRKLSMHSEHGIFNVLNPTEDMKVEILEFINKYNLPYTEKDINTYSFMYQSY